MLANPQSVTFHSFPYSRSRSSKFCCSVVPQPLHFTHTVPWGAWQPNQILQSLTLANSLQLRPRPQLQATLKDSVGREILDRGEKGREGKQGLDSCQSVATCGGKGPKEGKDPTDLWRHEHWVWIRLLKIIIRWPYLLFSRWSYKSSIYLHFFATGKNPRINTDPLGRPYVAPYSHCHYGRTQGQGAYWYSISVSSYSAHAAVVKSTFVENAVVKDPSAICWKSFKKKHLFGKLTINCWILNSNRRKMHPLDTSNIPYGIHTYKTTTKFLVFWTPSPPFSTFGTDMQRTHFLFVLHLHQPHSPWSRQPGQQRNINRKWSLST